MPLQHLEHFLIQTTDIEAIRDWYVQDHFAFRCAGLKEMLAHLIMTTT